MESDKLTTWITLTLTTLSGVRKRFPFTNNLNFDVLCQHIKDRFASNCGVAVQRFSVELIDWDNVQCVVESDFVLQQCLRRYFAKAAGSTAIDLDFLAEEIAEPEEKLLAPPKEVQHSTVGSVKPELDWSLFDFDTIDGPSFPVTSANATELSGAVSETASGDVKDEQRSLDGLPELRLLSVSSTPPSQPILPLAQDLHTDTPSQSGMSLSSSTQGDEADSTVHSDICSQDTTGHISDLESQIAGSSSRLEEKPGSRLTKKVKKTARTKKLTERYTVRKTPKKSAQHDKKAQQITPSKADTAATTSMVTTPAKERKNTPAKASKTPQKVSSEAIGSSKKALPMKSSGRGRTNNSVIAELRKAQAPVKIDYKLPKDYDGFRWVTEVCCRRTPYFPQVGDVVRYFRDIHKRFQQCVSHLSFVSPKVKTPKYQPFNKRSKMRIKKVETMEVKKVEFEIVSKVDRTRLAIVHLERRDCAEREKKNVIIYLQDMPDGVPQEAEFLVLKQFVDNAEAEYRKKGPAGYLKKRARLIVWDEKCLKWANGRIEMMGDPQKESQPVTFLFDILPGQQYPDEDTVSLWEVFVYADGAQELKHDSPLTMSELRDTSYQPEPEDWPGDRQVFKARILRIVGCLLKKGLLAGLPVSVDEKKWRFASSVPYPVTLKFLEKRLKTSYYRRKVSLEADVMHLLTTINSGSNMEDSASVLEEYNMKTQIVCDVVMEGINNLNFDEGDVEKFIDGRVALLCKNRGEFDGKKRPRAASAHPEDGPSTSSTAQKPEGPAAKKSRSGRESKSTSGVHRSLGSFV